MKKYRVRVSRHALRDLDSVFHWGMEYWGVEDANLWLDQLEDYIKTHLSRMPAAYPVAPESDEFGFEIRQLVYGRYRVLFKHDEGEVLVLRVRGPYTAPAEEP